ncbi:hypothetical protein Dsui_0770 [Azospira oryzae PS]|uniref:Uncharacterized protein n=1 Tax=Azospira oryzae (strain ATCC BAA-33 / DSM 13638 / PS) TaxID=640081 RepID=G8QHM7_AZOOP|nr:hypothetical protein [Azospira oryzae]AEV25178.1 hypothetical protein Dsui_0770 [Azospira oryzae PS]
MQQENNQGGCLLDLWQQALNEVEAETTKASRKKHPRLQAGEIVETSNGYAEVVEYINANNVKIRFIATQYETLATAQNIRDGRVKDRFLEQASGGHIGNTCTYQNGHIKPGYPVWKAMFSRVKERENYKEVQISDAFQCFEVFERWYLERQSEYPASITLALDSDLIPFLTDSPKSYSAETCLLLPHSVNTSFTKTKESLDSFSTDKPKGIVNIGEKWLVLTRGDKSEFEDRGDAIAYATDLLISGFMDKFKEEVLPYLSETDSKKVENLEGKLRLKYR